MIKVAILGAGELGSRHLQGLLKCSLLQEIYVLDKSEHSLAKARERAGEVPGQHEIYYVNEISQLPAALTLVVVATNANVRATVVTELLKNHRVDYLILEKVLFQSIQEYDEIDALLLRTPSTRVWVNLPRRIYPGYRAVKEVLLNNLSEASLTVVSAGNWGLGCNSLHFIDLFSYLWDSPLSSLSFSLLDDQLQESKRAGFAEFTGQVQGCLSNGAVFVLNSFAGDKSPFSIAILGSSYRILLTENGKDDDRLLTAGDSRYGQSWVGNIRTLPQSNLTGQLLEELLKTGSCGLTSYSSSSAMHRLFINGLLNKYNSITGATATHCPIT